MEIKESMFTPLSNVESVDNVDNVESKIDKIDILDIRQALTGSLLDSIIRTLVESSPLSYSEISSLLDSSYGSISKTMERNEIYFAKVDKQGQAMKFKLSPLGTKYTLDKTNLFKKNKEAALSGQANKIKELSEHESRTIQAREVLQNVPKDRQDRVLTLSFEDIVVFDTTFADYILDDPETAIDYLQEALGEKLEVRFTKLPASCLHNVEDLRAVNLDKLIMVEGRVVCRSDVRPQVVNARFECPNCGAILSVPQTESKFKEPYRCSCGWKSEFKLLSREMVDVARIVLEDMQEKTDSPDVKRISAFIKKSWTHQDSIKLFEPGNEVRLTGVLKEVPVPLRSGSISTRYDHAFEVINAEPCQEEVIVDKFSEEDISKIKETASKIDKEGLSVISTSFAPGVHGYECIKQGIILNSCNRRNDNTPDKPRNKGNILLIGDPGVAKTVLGKFAVDITPSSRQAVGGGSSAVGITASVVKEDNGSYSIIPGALALAKELLFIDEFNNLSDEDKPKLQEAMSEQTITINKATIHTKLKVTAGIIAAANPQHGVFKDYTSISEQFNIPPAILNRFDLIFVFRDEVDMNKDKAIAQIMLKRERNEIKPTFDKEFLRKFLVYMRHLPEPIINDDISERLSQTYADLRMGKKNTELNYQKVNARTIEAITRLVKSSAKIRLSSVVEQKDIDRVLKILSNNQGGLLNDFQPY